MSLNSPIPARIPKNAYTALSKDITKLGLKKLTDCIAIDGSKLVTNIRGFFQTGADISLVYICCSRVFRSRMFCNNAPCDLKSTSEELENFLIYCSTDLFPFLASCSICWITRRALRYVLIDGLYTDLSMKETGKKALLEERKEFFLQVLQ